MILTIDLRLQECKHADIRYFVPKYRDHHSIARGKVKRYVLQASSWTHARRVLKSFNTAAYTLLNKETADGFFFNVGTTKGSLREVIHG